jgi:tetratricopeptide (TPR) repeat protein
MDRIIALPIENGARTTTYDRLVEAFLAHGRETPALLQQVMDEQPGWSRVHATKAMMLTLLARSELQGAAQDSAAKAVALLAPDAKRCERAFVEAASAAVHGAWWAAIDQLELAITENPSDSLSAKMSHALRFMLGDKPGMLRSIDRVLDRLPAGHPHRGFLAGCHAFALEENGHYEAAEHVGRKAVALESRDAWGLHAVSHVHEMTGRFEEGIRWIENGEAGFRHCNNFGGHLFWHLALFKLETGAVPEVLDLYDRRVRGEQTDDFRDIANGASLLMRLELDGHPVGERWEELADKAEARLADGSYVFADLHYMLALIGAGRRESATMLARSMARIFPRNASQTLVAERAGAAMAEGLVSFAEGDMGAALERLLAVRKQRVMIGGSDAQRDVFEQVLLEAALRAGEEDVARTLLTERLDQRGRNHFAESRLARLSAPGGRRNGALGLAAALAFAVPAH